MLHVLTRLVPAELLTVLGTPTLFQLFPCCGTVHTYMQEGLIEPALATEIGRLAQHVSSDLVALDRPRDRPLFTVRYHRVSSLPGGKLAVAELDRRAATLNFRVVRDLIKQELSDALAAHATRIAYQLAMAR